MGLIAVPDTGVIVDTDKRQYILNITDCILRQRILDTVPGAQVTQYKDYSLLFLPLHDDTIRILHNLGYATSGWQPFYWEYEPPLIEGKFTALSHQLVSAAFMSAHPRCYNTSTMRTGKTASAVMALDYLKVTGRITGAALIIATVSNLTGVWEYSINTTVPYSKAVVVYGSKAARIRLLEANPVPDYYIINYDGVKLCYEQLKALIDSGKISAVVVDELTHYGNTKSQRFICLNKLINGVKPVKYVWGLTGTPGDDPGPVYGFCKLINPSKLPVTSKYSWDCKTTRLWGTQSWQRIVLPEAKKIIYDTMQPTIRFDKKDILDLPPVVFQQRSCDLTVEQDKSFLDMKDYMYTLTQSGEEISAVHKAGLMHKLFQIALGSIIGDDRKEVQLNCQPRLDLIVELIQEASAKVVIFCSYTAALHRLAGYLSSKKYSVGIVDGGVSEKKRSQIFSDFQYKKDPHVLICHPRTTAFGVELAAADTMIFNGPPISGSFIYGQAVERLSSIKQQAASIQIIQVTATPEERQFFKGLDSCLKEGEIIANMFKEFY